MGEDTNISDPNVQLFDKCLGSPSEKSIKSEDDSPERQR